MERRGALAAALVVVGAVSLVLLALSLTVEEPGRGPGERGGTGGGDVGGTGSTTELGTGTGGGSGSGSGGGGSGGPEPNAIPCIPWFPVFFGLLGGGIGAGIGAIAPRGPSTPKLRILWWTLGGLAVGAVIGFLLVGPVCEPMQGSGRGTGTGGGAGAGTGTGGGTGTGAGAGTGAGSGTPSSSGGGTPQPPPLDPKLIGIVVLIVLAILALVFFLSRKRGGRAGASATGEGDGGGAGLARGPPVPLKTQDAREVVAAYVAACERLAAAGHRRAPWETAGEYARRAPEGSRDAFIQLTRLYESVRHGDAPATGEATARASTLAERIAPAGRPVEDR